MKLIQFLISISFAVLSSIRPCNKPNLDPPDCNQIHWLRWYEVHEIWMKLNFWAITRIFSVVGDSTHLPSVTPTCPASCQSGHTQCGCDGVRAGTCFCHGEGILEVTTAALGVLENLLVLGLSNSSCSGEHHTLQCTCRRTLTGNDIKCTI